MIHDFEELLAPPPERKWGRVMWIVGGVIALVLIVAVVRWTDLTIMGG